MYSTSDAVTRTRCFFHLRLKTGYIKNRNPDAYLKLSRHLLRNLATHIPSTTPPRPARPIRRDLGPRDHRLGIANPATIGVRRTSRRHRGLAGNDADEQIVELPARPARAVCLGDPPVQMLLQIRHHMLGRQTFDQAVVAVAAAAREVPLHQRHGQGHLARDAQTSRPPLLAILARELFATQPALPGMSLQIFMLSTSYFLHETLVLCDQCLVQEACRCAWLVSDYLLVFLSYTRETCCTCYASHIRLRGVSMRSQSSGSANSARGRTYCIFGGVSAD